METPYFRRVEPYPSLTTSHVEPVVDVPDRLLPCERRERATHRHALVESGQLRRTHVPEQLGLPHEDDLDQVLPIRLEVGQHTNLLEKIGVEVLRLVNDHHARLSVG